MRASLLAQKPVPPDGPGTMYTGLSSVFFSHRRHRVWSKCCENLSQNLSQNFKTSTWHWVLDYMPQELLHATLWFFLFLHKFLKFLKSSYGESCLTSGETKKSKIGMYLLSLLAYDCAREPRFGAENCSNCFQCPHKWIIKVPRVYTIFYCGNNYMWKILGQVEAHACLDKSKTMHKVCAKWQALSTAVSQCNPLRLTVS